MFEANDIREWRGRDVVDAPDTGPLTHRPHTPDPIPGGERAWPAADPPTATEGAAGVMARGNSRQYEYSRPAQCHTRSVCC
jgi:hypothetical protein